MAKPLKPIAWRRRAGLDASSQATKAADAATRSASAAADAASNAARAAEAQAVVSELRKLCRFVEVIGDLLSDEINAKRVGL